jgi:hypothetical protein
MRGLTATLTGMSLALACAAAVSGEFTPETDDAIEACINAAVERLPGLVNGWQIERPTGTGAIRVDVLATNDRIWQFGCEGGAIVRQKSTNNSGDYQTSRKRVVIPERSARQTAAAAYPNGELLQMKYGRAWKGRVYYTYFFKLPDGREATVQVNTATGRIDETSSERKG